MRHKSVITRVFVYGTLQQHQVRGNLWPQPPLAVEPAYTRGMLFDLGPYPALDCTDSGPDQGDGIAGELWTFCEAHLPETLAALDRIEECNQGGANLYDLCLVRAYPFPKAADSVLAYAYQFSAAATLSVRNRMRPGPQGYVVWPVSRAGPLPCGPHAANKP